MVERGEGGEPRPSVREHPVPTEAACTPERSRGTAGSGRGACPSLKSKLPPTALMSRGRLCIRRLRIGPLRIGRGLTGLRIVGLRIDQGLLRDLTIGYEVSAALQIGVAYEGIRVVDTLQRLIQGQQSRALVDQIGKVETVGDGGVLDVLLRVGVGVHHFSRRIAHVRGPEDGQFHEGAGMYAPMPQSLAKILVIAVESGRRGRIEYPRQPYG